MAVGMPDADAAMCRGADGRGGSRSAPTRTACSALPQYIRRIRRAASIRRASIKVEKSAPATAVVDGDNGMGHLVMQRAADTAIALAKDTGVAWVGARRSKPRGRGRHLRRDGAAAQHDRHLFRRWPTPTTCRPGARPKACSAPIPSRSRCRQARRPRWCSTSPPRWSPTAP